jgi:aminoglycoside phosphotransferase (APT) family kinase protein
MHSRTKRTLTARQLDTMLRSSAGIGCRAGTEPAELTDGWFNSAYRVVLDDGRPAVVKVAPPDGVPVLRYERGIMATEATVYRQLAAVDGIPLPELIHQGPDFLIISVLDGIPWDKRDAPPDQEALRRELGRITARLHTVRSPDGRFGYPAPEAGLDGPDWPTAFRAMVDAILEDAAHWNLPLGVTPDEVRSLVADGADALAEVTVPALVHFDLWPGNIFIGSGRITGLIDHERALYGDPAAELVSLAFGGDTGPGSPLVAGYLEAGGELGSAPSLHHRLALYRLYLGLLTVAECGPRGYDADRLAHCQRALDDTLRTLREPHPHPHPS